MGFLDWLLGKSTPTPKTQPNDQQATAGVAVMDHDQGLLDGEDGATWWAPPDGSILDLQDPDRPDLSPDARALENLLVSHFDGRNLSMPPMLAIADRVLPELSREDYDVRKIADLLGEDQVVAAAVLRMANSPLYRGVNKITELPNAIGRLGAKSLRMLLLHESLRAATFHRHAELKWMAQDVWRRALAGAVIMRGLADLTGENADQGFLIGLLHNIGYVVALRVTDDYLGAVKCSMDIDDRALDYLCFETHQEFGELIADAWSLPADLKTIICDHHRDPDPTDPHRNIRYQILLTEMILSLLGYAEFKPYNLLESHPVQALELGHKAKFVVFLQQLPDAIEEVLETV